MLSIVLLLLISGRAWAASLPVSVYNTSDGCGVRGGFVAPVSAAIAWEVLADYDGISRFVKSMRSSRIERGKDGRRLLRQDAEVKLFLVRRHVRVLLELQEDPGHRLGFRDISGQDFRSYVGEWRLSGGSGQTRVEYELVAAPRAAGARSLCRGALSNAARDLLDQVRTEMMRRAAGDR